ncbi:hypothetical protein PAMP_003375 [Pampus punctatissimus]
MFFKPQLRSCNGSCPIDMSHDHDSERKRVLDQFPTTPAHQHPKLMNVVEEGSLVINVPRIRPEDLVEVLEETSQLSAPTLVPELASLSRELEVQPPEIIISSEGNDKEACIHNMDQMKILDECQATLE